MRAIRLYVDQKLAVQDEVELEDETRHHAACVLRINRHTPLILFNGDGYDYSGQTAAFDRKKIRVRLTDRILVSKESRLKTHLVLGVSKASHMDYAIQKSVEAGVTEIHPVMTERTVARFSDKSRANRQLHWQNIIINACEQCGRATLPVLHETRDLAILDPVREDATGFVLDFLSGTTLDEHASGTLEKVWLIIGPEGGLTRGEIDRLLEKGFQPVRLGPRVLRTETAALGALVAVQMLWGDLSGQGIPGSRFPPPP